MLQARLMEPSRFLFSFGICIRFWIGIFVNICNGISTNISVGVNVGICICCSICRCISFNHVTLPRSLFYWTYHNLLYQIFSIHSNQKLSKLRSAEFGWSENFWKKIQLKVLFTLAAFPCEFTARFRNINNKFFYVDETRHRSANSHGKSASLNEP